VSKDNNISTLLANLSPQLNEGKYVFVTTELINHVPFTEIISLIQEDEGFSLILKKEVADRLNLQYSYVASWITLSLPTSLDAVGLTAAFSNELAKKKISCNVVAGFYHDHIFVDHKDTKAALSVLNSMS
jgi:hypothetical protein